MEGRQALCIFSGRYGLDGIVCICGRKWRVVGRRDQSVMRAGPAIGGSMAATDS
jgi:hypothetical protein